MTKRSPLVAKGKQFPFLVAAACWIDLLGYGGMISEAGFNPLHANAAKALVRIRAFHKVVAEHSDRYFPTLVMNDGAVAYRDLSLRSRSVTHDFLVRSWRLFQAIKHEDTKGGHPGARLVLACGFRMRGRRAGQDAARDRFVSIVDRLRSGEIDAQQAVNAVGATRPNFDIVPQLQANFAFTKAYMAEQSGTRGGLPGPHFYVDKVIFDCDRPDWVDLGPDIHWAHGSLNLSATFAAVRDISGKRHPAGGPVDIRDGLAIAQSLAGSPNVLSALRAARKP